MTPEQLAGVAVLGGLGYGVFQAARTFKHGTSRYTAKKDRWLLPKETHDYNVDETESWLASFLSFSRPKSEWAHAGGQPSFLFRLVKKGNGVVRFYLEAPNDRLRGVQSNLPPTLEWHEIDRVERKAKTKYHIGATDPFAFLSMDKEDRLPVILRAMPANTALEIRFSKTDTIRYQQRLREERKKHHPDRMQGGQFSNAGQQIAGEIGQAVSDVLFGAPQRKTASRSSVRQEPRQTQPKTVDVTKDMSVKQKDVEERFLTMDSMFDVQVTFFVDAENDRAAFESVLAAMRALQGNNRLQETKRPTTMTLSVAELARWVHIPTPKNIEKLETIRASARTLQKEEFAHGVTVGFLRHPVQEAREVKIPEEQFKSHFLLSGATGSGKSTTLIAMIDSILDIWKEGKTGQPKPGFTLFDPADSTAQILLSHIAKVLDGPDDPRWEKVHYVSFSNADMPVPMNFFHVLGTDGILALLNQGNNHAIRSNRMIRNAVETLKCDTIPHALLGIPQILKDERFREIVLTRARRNGLSLLLRQFWERDFETVAKGPEVFEPVENRIDPFTKGAARTTFGQPDWAFDVYKWMEEGHIVLIGVKALGEQAMQLFAGSLIEHYHWTAQKRKADVAMTHYLMIDECHRVQIPIMLNILREDRKYGLSLGLITQSVEQFNSDLKFEIMDNVQTIISLRQGLKGAPAVAELSRKNFSVDYLQNLPTNVAAVFSIVNGIGTSVETWANPPETYDGYGENAVIVPFFDKPVLQKRREELRIIGREMQKELGKDATLVEKRLEKYLESANWAGEDALLEEAPKKRSKLY